MGNQQPPSPSPQLAPIEVPSKEDEYQHNPSTQSPSVREVIRVCEATHEATKEKQPSREREHWQEHGEAREEKEEDKGKKSSKHQQQKGKGKKMKGGLMFAIAITWCVSTEYIVLEFPQILPYVFVAQILPLLLYRIVTYYHRHWHHYTLELCYFSNALLIINILFFPQSDTLYLINFALNFGPVLMANLVYRCSFLMDDLQRFFSWFQHCFPPIVVFVMRWLPKRKIFHTCQGDSACTYDRAPYLLLVLGLTTTIGHALAYNIYVWEIAPASTRNHPHYQNSFLYITHSARESKFLMKLLNCFGSSRRAQVLSFTLMAQLFNAVVIALSYAAWNNMIVNLVFLLSTIFVTAYNGGTFYVHVQEKAASVSPPAPACVLAAVANRKASMIVTPLVEIQKSRQGEGGHRNATGSGAMLEEMETEAQKPLTKEIAEGAHGASTISAQPTVLI